MNDVDKLINEYYTPLVEEYDGGVRVLYRGNTSTDGIIWFERAKTGWVKKPIKQNHFIIVDADMTGVLDNISKYHNISEEDYQVIRTSIINRSIKVVNEYFNTDSE